MRTGVAKPPEIRHAGGRRFAVIAARFNQDITDALLDGALGALEDHGVRETDISILRVPGAWELPLAVAHVLTDGGYDGVVAIGCVIRGETPHFEFVAGGATYGLEALQRDSRIPVGFGLLTTDDAGQARARAGGAAGNKGREAALAVLEMVALMNDLPEGKHA